MRAENTSFNLIDGNLSFEYLNLQCRALFLVKQTKKQQKNAALRGYSKVFLYVPLLLMYHRRCAALRQCALGNPQNIVPLTLSHITQEWDIYCYIRPVL